MSHGIQSQQGAMLAWNRREDVGTKKGFLWERRGEMVPFQPRRGTTGTSYHHQPFTLFLLFHCRYTPTVTQGLHCYFLHSFKVEQDTQTLAFKSEGQTTRIQIKGPNLGQI